MTHFIRLVLLGALALSVYGQAPSPAEEIRTLNRSVLELLGDVETSTPIRAAASRSVGEAVIRRRAESLEGLIRQNPSEALGLAFPREVLVRLSRSFPQAARFLEEHGEWSGEVDYTIIDGHSMRSHEAHIAIDGDGGRLEVFFAAGEPDGLISGAVLAAKGVRAGGSVAATEESIVLEAPAPACGPIGDQKSAVLLVTFPGVAPPNISPATVNDIFFASSGRSLNTYWQETSYGKTWATGNVFGWYTLDAFYSCSEYGKMLTAAIAAADADVNFTEYTRVFVVFPTPQGCSFAGVANVGCRTLSSPGDGSFPASAAWLVANYMGNRDQGVKLVTHEAGHNLGLGHATAWRYSGEALGPIGAAASVSEYGDNFSTMGSWNFGQYSAPHRHRLNWFTSSANVQTVETSGTYAIEPIATPSSGPQALRIRRGSSSSAYLWVEARKPIGTYESTLASQVFTGALIHYEASGSYHSALLDFTPSTSSWLDPALVGGASWEDPYSDLRLRVESVSSGGLTLRVDYGTATCTPAAPSVSLSPPNPGIEAGNWADYSLTVTNQSSSGCPGETFQLASTVPQGWSGTLSASSLSLQPGQSGSTTLRVGPPAGTSAGTYAVQGQATANSRSGTAQANLTVTEPEPCAPVAPTLTMGPANLSTDAGGSASYSLTVTNRSSSACAAESITLTGSAPEGWSGLLTASSLTLAPGESRTVSFTVSPPEGTPAGAYTVGAQAASSSGGATAQATCTVNEPALPLTLTLTLDKSDYVERDFVNIMTTVASGSTPAARVTVNFTIQKSDGATVTGSSRTDNSGRATWKYRIDRRDPLGNYTASATATQGDQTGSIGPVSFQVR